MMYKKILFSLEWDEFPSLACMYVNIVCTTLHTLVCKHYGPAKLS